MLPVVNRVNKLVEREYSFIGVCNPILFEFVRIFIPRLILCLNLSFNFMFHDHAPFEFSDVIELAASALQYVAVICVFDGITVGVQQPLKSKLVKTFNSTFTDFSTQTIITRTSYFATVQLDTLYTYQYTTTGYGH